MRVLNVICMSNLLSLYVMANTVTGANWMTVLAKDIANKPLNQLFIPGSHDSATYALEHEFGKGQGFSDKINALKLVGVGFAVTTIAKNWAMAQDRTIYEQLNDGIRYLDLRVIYRDNKKDFYTVHGLYGPKFSEVLSQITRFMSENPKEILIIQVADLNYLGKAGEEEFNHQKLAAMINTAFTNKLVNKSELAGPSATVGEISRRGKQVFLLYKDKNIADQFDGFWHRKAAINDYWPDVDDTASLKAKLDANMKKRTNNDNQNKFFVTQSQMTPSTSTIAKGLIPLGSRYRSLKDMAKDVVKELPQWIDDWRNQNPNIIILDFVNAQRAKHIYLLN